MLFEDNSFDYVTIGFGLRNVPDYLVALKEMNRVLKPGGMVVCLETSQPTLLALNKCMHYTLNLLCLFLENYLQNQKKNMNGYSNLRLIFLKRRVEAHV